MSKILMSDRLQKQILANAGALWQPQRSVSKHIPVKMADRIYDAWLDDGHGEVIELIQRNGKSEYWLEQKKSVTLGYFKGQYVGKELRFSSARTFCNNYNSLDLSPVAEALLGAELETLFADNKALEERSVKFASAVADLLRQCRTLKQALHAWPELKSLVPEHVVKDYARRETRRAPRKKAEIAAETIEYLNSEFVTCKIINSQIS